MHLDDKIVKEMIRDLNEKYLILIKSRGLLIIRNEAIATLFCGNGDLFKELDND